MTSPFINAGYGDETTVYPTLPSGMQVGMKRMSKDMLTECTLVQNNSGGTLTLNKVCKLNAAGFEVIPTIAAIDIALGVADRCASAPLVGQYFWLSTRYYVSPLVAAGVALGATVSPSTVSGQLQAAPAANNNQTSIVAMAASGAGGATLCFIH